MPDPDSIRIISLIAFACFFVIGFFKPYYMAISFIILFLCKLSHYYPFLYEMRAELIVGIVSFFWVLIFKGSLKKLSAHYNLVNKYLILFLVTILISFLVSIDRSFSWESTLYDYIKVLIIYIIILGAIEDEADLKKFSWFFVFLFAYLAYEPMYGFLTGTAAVEQMYGETYIGKVGVLSGHVAAANNMNQMIPIALFLFLSIQNKTLKVFGFIPVLIFIIVLVGSGSRGGVIGFFALCVVTIILTKKTLKSGFVVSILALIIVTSSATFMYTGSRITESSIRGRLIGLSHGIEMILKGHPFGVGPGCYMVARGKYFGHTMMAHNIYGEVIGDLGIPGTIAWFFLIRQILLNLLYAKKTLESLSLQKEFLYRLTMGLLISLIVRLVISMGSHGLYYFYWYLIAAMSVVVCKNVEKIAQEHSVDTKDLETNRFSMLKFQTPSRIQ